MCGIAGIVNIDPKEISVKGLKVMSDCIAHRGPDGEGFWISDDGSTGLGHRRLSIIDLSPAGAQPMHYLHYTIIFNGEIYNYIELKNDLKKRGYKFTTGTDTEAVMALYDAEKEKCLQLLDGMFSFVIHDNKEKKIFCARDRFGEKPFFYSFQKNRSLVFASEIKAILAYTGHYSINYKMLYNYLGFGYMNNSQDPSETFYQNILKLPHAHYMTVDTTNVSVEIKEYWKIDPDKVDMGISTHEAVEKFSDLFYTSVNRRLRSDVNVGSSLSGGIDSSVIVSVIDDLLKKNKAEHSFESSAFKQKTFSARFPGFKRDESDFMQMVIDRTNVEPHFVNPTGETLLEDIDRVYYYQDEPFGGASILVQYEVMKLAKENDVTVLLDGQGADEVLAGYHWYYGIFFRELEKRNTKKFQTEYNQYRSLHKNNPVNRQIKKGTDYQLRKILPGQLHPIKRSLAWIDQKRNKHFNPDFFSTYAADLYRTPNAANHLNRSLYGSTMGGDLQTLLRYADRNSMAFSREVRLPFLSHELVEFIFSLPAECKIHEGWTKWILRKTFEPLLPKEICWRTDKIGYEPPQKKWMEASAIKERIIESRKKLVANGILNKNILHKDPQAYGASEAGDRSWEHLMAGYLIR